MEAANKTESDFAAGANNSSTDMDMPEGFTPVQQTRLWFMKEEGAILHGVILSRVERKDSNKAEGVSYFYEVRAVRECKTTTADEDDGAKKVEFIAQPGQIICIDEFAGNGNWKHQLPAGGKGTEVWMKFIRKDKIPGTNKSMWKVKPGFKVIRMADVKVNEDVIPF